MQTLRKVLRGLSIVALFGIFISNAGADEQNKQTFVTFKEPVEIPGQVLLPGTYIFKVVDTLGDPNIVQVWTDDNLHLLATIQAVPTETLDVAHDTIFTFEQRQPRSPLAIKTWFYPGDRTGQEFVYPRGPAHSPSLAPSADK
jgi:hypothetical protein